MRPSDHWIEKKSAGAIFPEQVFRTLSALLKKWPVDAPPLRDFIEAFPLGENALLHLFSASSICALRLTNEPEILLWLGNAEVCQAARGYGRMLAELERSTSGEVAANHFYALRRWKAREMTRIALREVAEAAPLEETMLELSQLAEISLAQVFIHWNRELRSRLGSPEADFAVLGLGKLGGHELNHSSDIDLIFLYSHEGQLSAGLTYHEWFNRLSTKIIETFSLRNPDGALFRIDLRLRPEGAAGPLARSLESMENYYAGFGEAWEQLALIKARGVCGSKELAYEFLRQHQPFIYPKNPTRDLFDEIAAIKRRIERDVVGYENLQRDVKLGAGGIREIEFIVQALQLAHGARHAFLQEASTLKTLRALAQLDLLPKSEVVALDAAYHFLRRVEHRLQIEAEQQTHIVPETPEALQRLAHSLGFESAGSFTARLQEHMGNVRAMFQKTVARPEGRGNDLTEARRAIFRDQTRATKTLADLAHGPARFHVAPRTRQIFRKLHPLLLERLAKVADPDATLNQFVRFVEAYGLRSLLFELLVVNPRLLELLIKTLDASRYAAELLVRRPQLLDELTRPGMLDDARSVADHLRRLESHRAESNSLNALRTYRQTQWLRILLRDLFDLASLDSIVTEQSDLAEACLVFLNRLLDEEQSLTIIALGKFGGREISYGADLDVVFVGENTKAAQNLLLAMGQPTAEGTIWPLDTRLRPEGEKGPLVSSLATHETYYRNRAQLWELQALTRARPIAGPQQTEFAQLAERVWRAAGQRENLFRQVNTMTERIRRERGSRNESLAFKTGLGGIVEAEFLVQALQMRAAIWNPSWSEAVTELAEEKVFSPAEADRLRSSYTFLRRCESALRRWENKGVSSLPGNELEQCKLANWVQCENFEAFVQVYDEARRAIHALYTARLSVSA